MNYLRHPLTGIFASALLLVGCDSDPSSLRTAELRVFHASPDAPNVNVLAGAEQVVADLAYREVSPFETVAAGSTAISVDAIVPGGTARVIGPENVTLNARGAYSLVALGDALTIAPLVLEEPTEPVAAGQVRVRVVHAAPAAPRVAVYATAPTAPLAQSVPLGTIAFGETVGPASVAAGEYRIRVTLPNDPATVVFDSGTVALPAGGDLLVLAVENTRPGTAPISLLVATDTDSFEILDVATPSEIRVIHASPDAPAVDIIVDDNFAAPALENVPFPAASDYLAVPPGAYNVKVTPADNAGVIVIDANVELDAGRQYSVYATGTLSTIAPYVLVDDNRSIATEAKVRIVHTAPGAGLVDIYVTAPGADIANAAPAFSNVAFRAETGYVSLAGGSYTVTVTVAGTKTAAIGPLTIAIEDGRVYTAAARDAVGGGAPFGLILLDDFIP
jgi:hypothetical protein